jgi:hypothetical protein
VACKDNVFPQKAIILEIQNGIWQKQYQKPEIAENYYFPDKVADNLNAWGKPATNNLIFFVLANVRKQTGALVLPAPR